MEIEKIIRKLAKQIDSLNLFSAAKEINNIYLFKNNIDFSRLQRLYISYLYFYNELYQDVATKKIDEKILESEIYEDSYILWKRKNPDEYFGLGKDKNKKRKSGKKSDVHLVF